MIDKRVLGESLAKLRKDQGLNQKQLAMRLGISDKAISKWETGGSLPPLEMLARIADELHLSLPKLIESLQANGHGVKVVAIIGQTPNIRAACISYLSETLERRGWKVMRVGDAATRLNEFGITSATCNSNIEFQGLLFTLQMHEEDLVFTAAEKQQATGSKCVVLCNAGAYDCAATMSQSEFANLLGKHGIDEDALLNRYSDVIHLGKPPCETTIEDGRNANTSPVSETPRKETRIDDIWRNHPLMYAIPEAADGQTILQSAQIAMLRMLGETIPALNTNATRLLVRKPKLEDFIGRSKGVADTETAMFTVSANGNSFQLIKRMRNGSESYWMQPSSCNFTCSPDYQTKISTSGYSALQMFEDGTYAPIERIIVHFMHEGQSLSLILHEFLPYAAILEGTPAEGSVEIELPPYLTAIRDITDSTNFIDERFSRALAQGKL